MKAGRGWWALGAVGVLTAFGLYVGSYYATTTAKYHFKEAGPFGNYEFTGATPIYRVKWTGPLFIPIHQIDRRLRPEYWNPSP